MMMKNCHRRGLSRRSLLKHAGGLAMVAAAPKLALGRVRFGAYPFTLGIASGDPVADGFVLWTRLAPQPLEGGGMPQEAVPVRWEVSGDERFLQVVKRGEAVATPELAHSVHVDVTGLEPDRWYFYRFISGGEASPIGRTRTFPVRGAHKDRLRFAFASCQHFGQGYFTAYDAMMKDDLDLIVHLGDYIYESDWGPKIRFHLREPATLEDYRNHHALYKSDAHLQAAHAWHPFAAVWDDHEVDNDYAGDQSEERTPVEAFLKRRAAAYQAYYEHMPLRRSARPDGSGMRLYSALTFGDLAAICMLDGRQYRSDQPCQGPEKFGGQIISDCPERQDPARTMLGPLQERWLFAELQKTQALWKVIAQQTLMASIDQGQGEASKWWSDGWDGYPAARNRLLTHLSSNKVKNAVVISGDVHSFWVNDLQLEDGSTIATEFVATSVTSAGIPYERIAPILPKNPHVKFFESRERGYVRVEVTPDLWKTDLRAMSTVASPIAEARTLKSFIVGSGQAGAAPA